MPEQLTELYRSVRNSLEEEYPIFEERAKLLKQVSQQIESAVPNLEARIDNLKKLEAMDAPEEGGMQFCCIQCFSRPFLKWETAFFVPFFRLQSFNTGRMTVTTTQNFGNRTRRPPQGLPQKKRWKGALVPRQRGWRKTARDRQHNGLLPDRKGGGV